MEMKEKVKSETRFVWMCRKKNNETQCVRDASEYSALYGAIKRKASDSVVV